MRSKRLQDRSKSVKFAPRASKSSRDVERKVDNKNLSRLKFAPRTSKSSRDDVERNLENKHFNLQSEAHAQNGQRGAARDESSEDLVESEVRPTIPTKNRLHIPKESPGVPEQPEQPQKTTVLLTRWRLAKAQPAHGRSLAKGRRFSARRAF